MYMEEDEETIQMKTLSYQVAESVVSAYQNRFKRFDSFERTVILNSLIKVTMFFLRSLDHQEKIYMMNCFAHEFDKILNKHID